MGTRADFYVGRGPNAEWLGSIAWDGYPDGIAPRILAATDEQSFRADVAGWVSEREDGTLPARGWPWPWNDSATTDYAYAFDGEQVWRSRFGGAWVIATAPESGDSRPQTAVFPNMSERRRVARGSRSGLFEFGVKGGAK